MLEDIYFSPTQQRLIDLLADGQPHLRSHLVAELHDELADRITLKSYLRRLRVKLRPRGQDIIAQSLHRRIYYRHVRLLNGPPKGGF